jgi:hypothetical protein
VQGTLTHWFTSACVRSGTMPINQSVNGHMHEYGHHSEAKHAGRAEAQQCVVGLWVGPAQPSLCRNTVSLGCHIVQPAQEVLHLHTAVCFICSVMAPKQAT